jgi:hypothetical protein
VQFRILGTIWVIPNRHPKYRVSPEPKPNQLGFHPLTRVRVRWAPRVWVWLSSLWSSFTFTMNENNVWYIKVLDWDMTFSSFEALKHWFTVSSIFSQTPQQFTIKNMNIKFVKVYIWIQIITILFFSKQLWYYSRQIYSSHFHLEWQGTH